MCAPIPENKWSWKYDKCQGCGTTSKAKGHYHKGRGFCIRCWDRLRDKKQRRKEVKKQAHDKWYLKVKQTPGYHEWARKYNEKWRKNPKSGYRLFLKHHYRELRFKRIIENLLNARGRKLERNNGIRFVCEGCNKSCQIISPITSNKELQNKVMLDLGVFRKLLIKMCNKKS